jgi:hypothetical protein
MVDGGMEKKLDIFIPADLKRLFFKWDIYVLLVTKWLKIETVTSKGRHTRRPSVNTST